jgi:peroxiredoxin
VTLDRGGGVQQTALATSAEVTHLVGLELPDIRVPATTAVQGLSLRDFAGAVSHVVVYAYPAIGAPDRDLITPDWLSIPGAFGCTAESCSFRDLNAVFADLGAAVCGLSTQSHIEQTEAAQRLSLNFPLLSDHEHSVTDHLGLPTWSAGGHRLLKRFTIVTIGTMIEHIFAPVADPAAHANDVAAWLRSN